MEESETTGYLRIGDATRVYLDGMPDRIPVIKEATELHLASRVGGCHEHCTGRLHSRGLAPPQGRARIRMVNQIGSRRTAAQASGICIDYFVPRRT